jgi:hypothetical protein
MRVNWGNTERFIFNMWRERMTATSYSRAYLASCLRHSAQIPRSARNFRYAPPVICSVWAGRGDNDGKSIFAYNNVSLAWYSLD